MALICFLTAHVIAAYRTVRESYNDVMRKAWQKVKAGKGPKTQPSDPVHQTEDRH